MMREDKENEPWIDSFLDERRDERMREKEKERKRERMMMQCQRVIGQL
jgi:hypothetical protein